MMGGGSGWWVGGSGWWEWWRREAQRKAAKAPKMRSEENYFKLRKDSRENIFFSVEKRFKG